MEGEAMLAAARKYNKVVQVGMQRRSTPHLVEAKKKIVDSGMLGKVSHVEMCCYYHMRANRNPPVEPVPDFFDYEMWMGPAQKRPFDGLPHRGWWRAMMEYSNGITGDMCVHMFDAVRWMLDLGWPKRITSSGGIYVQKESKAPPRYSNRRLRIRRTQLPLGTPELGYVRQSGLPLVVHHLRRKGHPGRRRS